MKQNNFQLSLNFDPPAELNPNVVLLEDSRFGKIFRHWKAAKQFGFDIETFSNSSDPDDALHPDTGEIRLIQIGINIGQEIYCLVIDLGWSQDRRTAIHQLLCKMKFWKVLKAKLSDYKTAVIGHSLNFEQKWMLEKFGYPIRNLKDTKLMSQIYWAGLDPWLEQVNNQPHSLASVCLRLGLEIDKTEQKSNWALGCGNGILTNAQFNYAATDASVVLKVCARLTELLKAAGLLESAEIECNASPAFAQMEHYGMPVCESKLEEIVQQYQAVYQSLIDSLKQTFPAVAYIDSPKKLLPIINSKFKLKLKDTSADSLSGYWHISELKQLSLIRTLSTYLDYLKNLQAKGKGGFVTGQYKQIAPKGFGRSICANPNLQNPPNFAAMPAELKEYNLPPVRSAFQAPKGFCLIVGDLSKAHSRIGCEASQDSQLTFRFNSSHGDIFCSIATAIASIRGLGQEWTEENIRDWKKDKIHSNHNLAALLYTVAKNVHYGCMNLQGFKTLQKTIRTGSGIKLSDEEAKLSQLGWKKTYSILAKFQQKIIREANSSCPPILGLEKIASRTKFGLGYVRTITGRGVFLAKYPSDFESGKVLSVRGPDATAAYWTMAEADIIKLALGQLIKVFDLHPKWGATIGNCCHDEIDSICYFQFATAVATAVQTEMRLSMSRFIKSIPVDEDLPPSSLICQTWAEK